MGNNRILVAFLNENKDKNIKLIFANGFQLLGRLIDYDDYHMLIQTNIYGHGKKVPIPFAAITGYVPDPNN